MQKYAPCIGLEHPGTAHENTDYTAEIAVTGTD